MYPSSFPQSGPSGICGHVVDLTKVKNDLFVIAGVTDHITPWKSLLSDNPIGRSENIEFILSHSGHIQALLNPPGNLSRNIIANEGKPPPTTDSGWQGHRNAGSWWPLWVSGLKHALAR